MVAHQPGAVRGSAAPNRWRRADHALRAARAACRRRHATAERATDLPAHGALVGLVSRGAAQQPRPGARPRRFRTAQAARLQRRQAVPVVPAAILLRPGRRAGDAAVGRAADRSEGRRGGSDWSSDVCSSDLNERPIYPRMALSWGWYPEALHSNPGPERVRADFARLKQLGYNGVKLCLWFPPQYYFDLADELGMLLWVELPIDRKGVVAGVTGVQTCALPI